MSHSCDSPIKRAKHSFFHHTARSEGSPRKSAWGSYKYPLQDFIAKSESGHARQQPYTRATLPVNQRLTVLGCSAMDSGMSDSPAVPVEAVPPAPKHYVFNVTYQKTVGTALQNAGELILDTSLDSALAKFRTDFPEEEVTQVQRQQAVRV